MKHLLLVFFAIIFIALLNSCRKKDCPAPQLIKTDALSNNAWIGAYGRHRLFKPEDNVPTDVYDTVFILLMKNDGFFDIYKNHDTAQVNASGKGFYSFDGTDFQATFSFFQIGRPYTLKGKVNDLNQLITGKMSYGENDTTGVFQIVIAQPYSK